MADEKGQIQNPMDQQDEGKARKESPPGEKWKRESRSKPELDQNEIRITVGQLIAIRRRQLKWSQEELAWQSGLSRNQVGRIERDESSPTPETIEALEAALGTELYERFMDQKRDQAKGFNRRRKSPAEKMIAQLAQELEQRGISEEDLKDALNRAKTRSDRKTKSE